MILGCALGGACLVFASPTASADVTADGSFATSVNIQVPSFHGLQPSLALDYTSAGPNGPYGLGWSMAAASTIQRVANRTGVPHWDASDQYVLDGGLLVACAGGSGTVQASPSCADPVAGTVAYTTETEMYLRVAFDPSANVWKIWRPNGVVVTYKAVLSPNPSRTSAWGVSTVVDRSGNTVTYDWSHDAPAEPVLADIAYADVRIDFGYRPRPDPLSYAVGDGTAVKDTTRLDNITESITDTGQNLRSYQLTYAAGSGPSLLRSVQLIGGDGTTSLPATTFNVGTPGTTWNPGDSKDLPGFSPDPSRNTIARAAYDVPLPGGGQNPDWLSLDANGDGRDDLVAISAAPYSLGPHTTVGADLSGAADSIIAAASTTDVAWGLGGDPGTRATATIGDVNGDGQDDIVLSHSVLGSSSTSLVKVLYGQSTGQFAESRGGSSVTQTVISGVPLVGDVNGDGHADLIIEVAQPACDGNGGLEVYLDDGLHGFRSDGTLSCWPTKVVNPGTEQVVDLDGDGRADVAAFTAVPGDNDTDPSPPHNAQLKVALADSRGRFDMHVDDTGKLWKLADTAETLGTKKCEGGAEGGPGSSSDEFPSTTVITHTFPEWSDMNSDGRTDLVLLGPGDAANNHDVVAHVFLSRGDGTFSPEQTWSTHLTNAAVSEVSKFDCSNSQTIELPQDLILQDVSGDGLPDLVDIDNGPDGTAGPASVSFGNAATREFDCGTQVTQNQLPACSPDSLTKSQWAVPPCPGLPCPHPPLTMMADFNGDGAPDLGVITSPEKQPTFLHVVPGHPREAPQPKPDDRSLWPGGGPTLRADVNGDGLPDLVLVNQIQADQIELTVTLRTSTGYRPAYQYLVDLSGDQAQYWNAGRWLVADINGDHLDDLLNIPDGGRTALIMLAGSWQPQALTLHQFDSSRVVTVPGHKVCEEGPNGKPFCYIEGGGTKTVPVNAQWPASASWQVADVNGDGTADLVHLGAGDGQTTVGAGVLTVFGSSTGDLTPEWRPIPGTDQPRWDATDVDGDGQSDLVHVNDGDITTLLRRGTSWVALTNHVPTVATAPAGQASPETDLYVDGGQDAWMPAHLTSGSTSDLVRVLSDPSQPRILIETLTALGDGTWSPSTQQIDLPTDSTPTAWQPIDLNGDGHTDLLGLLPGPDSSLRSVELIWSGQSWTAVSSDTSTPANGYSQWSADTDLGQPEITSKPLHDGSKATIAILAQTGDEPLITGTDNGLGASTAVTYNSGTSFASSGAYKCQTPTGSMPWVVTDLTTDITGSGTQTEVRFTVPAQLDGAPATLSAIAQHRLGNAAHWPQIWRANRGRKEPHGTKLVDPDIIQAGWTIVIPHAAPTIGGDVVDHSSFNYSCARYSNILHHFLGFAHTTTTHTSAGDQAPGTLQEVTRQIDDGGIDQVIAEDARRTAGGDPNQIATTTTDYEPVGPVPYHNLIKSTSSGNCDPDSLYCALNMTTVDSRDDFGNPTQVTERAAGSNRTKITQIGYINDNTHWLHGLTRQLQITDPNDPKFIRKTLTCYDGDTSPECDQLPERPRGLPTLTRQWDGTGWVQTGSSLYDDWGNRIQATTPGSALNTTNIAKTTYDPQLHLFPIEVTNSLGQTTQSPWPWDRRAEAPLKTIAASGAVTQAHFDPLGRPDQVTGPTGVVSKTTYETGSRGTATTVTTSSDAGTTWTRAVADGLGHTYRTETPNAKGQVLTAETTYLNATLVAAQTAPHKVSEDPTAYTSYSYDSLGQVTATINADGTQSRISRSIGADRLMSTTSTDEAGRRATSITDGWDAQLKLHVPSVEHDSDTATTTTTYDIAGDVLTVTDPHGNVLTFTWNPLGQETAQDDPDTGLTRYQYDPAGNVDQTIDARGRKLTYTYDRLNRQVSRTDATTGEFASWRYDEGGGANIGQLTSVTDSSAKGCPTPTSHRYTYDLLGDVLTSDACTLGITSTTAATYDNLGDIKTLQYPDSRTITYAYNDIGQISGVSDFVQSILYDDTGRPTTFTNANNTTTSTIYNPQRGWLQAQSLTDDTHPARPAIFDQTNEYDPTGLVLTTSSTSTGQETTNSYNAVGELQSSADSLQPGPADQMTYDDLGNLQTRFTTGAYRYAGSTCKDPSSPSRPVGSSSPRPANSTCTGPGPHAATSAGKITFKYDPAGNTTSRADGASSTAYSWTSEGQLAQIKTASSPDLSNTYDADGNLVATTIGKKTQVYAGTSEHINGGWLNRVYASGTLIGEMTPKHWWQFLQPEKKRRHWLQTDRTGSVRAVTDYKGRLIGSVDYTDWGEQEHASGTTSDLSLSGHHPDANLVTLGARMYDPTTGRMLSPDTIIPEPGPIGLNRYAYAYNAPTTYIDPSGHRPIDPMERHQGINWTFMSGVVGSVPTWATGQPNYRGNNCVTIQCMKGWLNPATGSSPVLTDPTLTYTPTAGQFHDATPASGTPTGSGGYQQSDEQPSGDSQSGDQQSGNQGGGHQVKAPPGAPPYAGSGNVVDYYPTPHGWVTVVENNGTYSAFAWDKEAEAYTDFAEHFTQWLNDYTARQSCSGPFCGLRAQDFANAQDMVYGFARFEATTALTAAAGPILGAVLGKIGGAAAAMLPAALRIGKNAEAGVDVYMGMRGGESMYSGISNNFWRRQSQHGAKYFIQEITDVPVTRGEGRAIEQALIVRNRGENIRNSISPSHEYYQEAVDWGEAWLKSHGY